MAMIDDIMQQLSNLGINPEGGFSGIAGISPEQVSQQLQSQYNLSSEQLPTSLFQPISADLLRGGMASTYSPQIEATGGSLLQKMLKLGTGQQGMQAAGGLQQQQFASGIKDVYGKGMTDVLTQTGQQRAKSLSSIQDLINSWQSQALQIKGYQ